MAAMTPHAPQFDTLAITSRVVVVTHGRPTNGITIGIAAARLPIPISFPPSPMPTLHSCTRNR